MSRQAIVGSQTKSGPSIQGAALQRKCACGQHTRKGECEECRKNRSLQRRKGNLPEPESVPPIVHEALRSPGQPLDAATRAFMETRFGHDLSRVRVHDDAAAAKSAQTVNALAYTVGHNVVFGAGLYKPETIHGRRLLAHELTHTIQQNAGASQGEPSTLRFADSGHESEREAEASESNIDQSRSLSVTSMGGFQIARKSPCDALTKQQAASKSSKDTSPWEEGWDWLTGQHGDKERIFRLGDQMTEELRKHESIAKARIHAAILIKEACSKDSNSAEVSDEKGISYELKGLEGVGKYLSDASTVATLGLTGNLTVAFLVSYHGCWSAKVRCCEGKARIHFHVRNESGLTSGTHLPILGYDKPRPSVGDWLVSPIETAEKWGPTLPGSLVHNKDGEGAMSTVAQIFDWEEPLSFSPPMACPNFPAKSFPANAKGVKSEKSGGSSKSKNDSKVTKTEGSVASVSWIDRSSPAGDFVADPPPPDPVADSFVTGGSGFRFSNYLHAWVDSTDAIHVEKNGFHANSGLYRGPSFQGISSLAYPTRRAKAITSEGGIEGIEFEQLAGARTVSAGVIGGGVGRGVASSLGLDPALGRKFGSAVANRITNFPPIWTRIKMRLFANGQKRGELSEQSLFPSNSFYCDLSRVSSYTALDAEQNAWEDVGWDSGNPWGASRPLGGL